MSRIKILLAIIVLTVAIIFVTPVLVAPLLGNRITSALNEKYTDYSFKIDKVHWSIFSSNLNLKKITVSSIAENAGIANINGEIASIQLKGINLMNALFKKKYGIDEVIISNGHLQGTFPFYPKKKRLTVSSINLQIGNLLFDQIDLSLKDSASNQTFILNEGILKIVDMKIEKLDTLGIFNHLDFEAKQILSVSADSFYTYQAKGFVYSDTLKNLSIEALLIDPNYNEYDFTAKHIYESDRIEAAFNHIDLKHFSALDYFNSGNFVSSYIEVGNMDLHVFRDKRIKDTHKIKPTLQEVIYKFPNLLRIDSIGINGGNIKYTEHAEKANEAGWITINELKAGIYNVTNDSIFKVMDASLEMEAEALLMGKSKMTISLKAKLFDQQNTFSMNGTLAELDVKELNPILEKNAFVYANSAIIDKIEFNFMANDTKSTGKMIMLYHDLDIAVKNKRTDDTSAFKEQIISLIANNKAWDSNPSPGDKVRVGIIHYERDPTKFMTQYCIKSIISGIKSSIIKGPEKKKNFLQKIFSNSHKNQKMQ